MPSVQQIRDDYNAALIAHDQADAQAQAALAQAQADLAAAQSGDIADRQQIAKLTQDVADAQILVADLQRKVDAANAQDAIDAAKLATAQADLAAARANDAADAATIKALRDQVAALQNPTPAELPVVVTVDTTVDVNQATLTWSIDAGTHDVSGAYAARDGLSQTGTTPGWESSLKAGASGSQTFLNLKPSTAYTLTVTPVVDGARGTGQSVQVTTKATPPVLPPAPTNTAAPTVSGTAQVTKTLTVSPGTWTGTPDLSYQWRANGVAITDATGTSYSPTASDVGKTLTVVVTGTNAGGTATATTAATAAVTAAPAPALKIGMVYGDNADLAAWETRLGKKLTAYHGYYTLSTSSNATAINRAKSELAAGRTPFLTFKLPSGTTWADAAAGQVDSTLTALASALSAAGGTVYVGIHHEPEGDGVLADWLAMTRHVGPLFDVANVKFVANFQGYPQFFGTSDWKMDAVFPTDAKIKVVLFDPYQSYLASGDNVTDMTTSYYKKMGDWAKAHGVDWGVAETGLSDAAWAARTSQPTFANWFPNTKAGISANGGILFCYFNHTGADAAHSWTLSGTKETAFAAIL